MFCKCNLLLLLTIFVINGAVVENTGQMELNEKLFSIRQNQISLDVNLKYSAGIKVNQKASMVGLGFDLSIPYVERIAVGSADEKDGSSTCNDNYHSVKNYNKLLLPNSNAYLENPAVGDFTAQQDNYSINAPFAEGQIVFAQPTTTTFTTNSTNDEIIVDSDYWKIGDKVRMTGDHLPVPFTFDQNKEYFVVSKTGTVPTVKLKLSKVSGGAVIDIILDGTGSIVSKKKLVPYLQKSRSVIVDYEVSSDANITKWSFIDENGVEYIFGKPVKLSINDIGAKGRAKSHNKLAFMWNWVNEGAVTFGESYINASYNYRWYLTEIRGSNYKSGTGDIIRIEYTDEQPGIPWFDATCFFYTIPGSKIKVYATPESNNTLISLYKFLEGSAWFQVATFADPNTELLLHPVYPIRIYSDFESAEFSRSPTDDILQTGKEKIDQITLKTKQMLRQKIKFHYDAEGLSINHPYSIIGKGRLMLDYITTEGSNGAELPLIKFQYASNPSIEYIIENSQYATDYIYTGMLKHDFFGYYNNISIKNRHPFTLADEDGQSSISDGTTAGAEAWSVYKVTYGNGLVEEYEYETGEIKAISTNEDISANPFKCGIRVKKFIQHAGIGGTDITTNYAYGKGYTQHNYSIDGGVDYFYAWLNAGDFKTIKNILLLQDIQVTYDFCQREITGNGFIKTHFLNPASSIKLYKTNTLFPLNDRYVSTGGVNSFEHYRGSVSKIETYSQSNLTVPISTTNYNYEIHYNLKQYTKPKVVEPKMVWCAVGSGNEEDNPEEASNLNETDFIGFLRLRAIDEIVYGINKKVDYLEYNEDNGLPCIIRKTNSAGKKHLTKTLFAFEEKVTNGTLAYQGIKDQNILTLVSQSIVYEKDVNDNSYTILPENVRAANATFYSNNLGSGTWSPFKNYSWNVDMDKDGIPVLGKPFSNYIHSNSITNQNWKLMQTFDMYDNNHNIMQMYKSQNAKTTTIYRNDFALPIGVVRKSTFFETGIFTGDYTDGIDEHYWDYKNGWEKGDKSQVTLLDDASKCHFGQKVIYVEDNYAAGRNNRVYAGKSYVMTAWVKVVEGTLFMAAGYHWRNARETNPWPIPGGALQNVGLTPDKISLTAAECAGKWKLMKLVIPVSKTESMVDNGKEYYARAWVGNYGDFGNTDGVKAYIDDVRFYPEDALVISTFYDQKWREPVLTIDENNNPGHLVVLDQFGRMVQRYKVDKNNPGNNKLLTSNEYFMMGQN